MHKMTPTEVAKVQALEALDVQLLAQMQGMIEQSLAARNQSKAASAAGLYTDAATQTRVIDNLMAEVRGLEVARKMLSEQIAALEGPYDCPN